MKHYYCNEDAENLVRLEIENRKEALKVYDDVIELVNKFDGKVLNKRFDTALKKIDERLSYGRSYNAFEIEFSVWNNRNVRSVKKDSFGHSNWNYIETGRINLNTYTEVYSHNNDGKSMLCEERIISSVLVEKLIEGKKHIEIEIEKLENSIEKVAEWKERLTALKNEMENTMKEIPYLVREYYDMNYSVTNN